MIISRSMFLQMILFHSFSWLSNIPLCIYVPHLLYPCIFWWALGFLLQIGYCRYFRLKKNCQSWVLGLTLYLLCDLLLLRGREGTFSLNLGRLTGGGNGNTLQYSCLGNPMRREVWWATDPWGHKESDTTEHTGMEDWNTLLEGGAPVDRFLDFLLAFVWDEKQVTRLLSAKMWPPTHDTCSLLMERETFCKK